MGGQSTISHSRSNQDGGAFAVLSGSVSVAGGSRVVQSSALQRGGCVYTQGGAQVGIRTNVSPGPSHMRSAPQLNPLLIRAGSIHFIRSFIEAAEAGEEDGEYVTLQKGEHVGPGGLDPAEVFETLPKVMQEAFGERSVDALKTALTKLSAEDAQYHMQRCIDSGLWDPQGAGGGDDD